MNILAVETATPVISVAMMIQGRVIERSLPDVSARAEGVLALFGELFEEAGAGLADVEAVAFGRGPGSFTGLRVAATVAQGLAYARHLPVIPISSLAALAWGAKGAYVLAAIDARQDQVYYGFFKRTDTGWMEPLGAEQIAKPSLVRMAAEGAFVGIGNGFCHYPELANVCGIPFEGGQAPSAGAVAFLAEQAAACGLAVTPDRALPVYLRDDIVKAR